MSMVCPCCYSIYRDRLVINRCPKLDCVTGELIEIDEMMAPIITTLWKKGYDTKACCSGHVTSLADEFEDDVYIAFDLSTLKDPFALITAFTRMRDELDDYLLSLDMCMWTGEHYGLAFYVRFGNYFQQHQALAWFARVVDNLPEVSREYFGGKDGYWDMHCRRASIEDLHKALVSSGIRIHWDGILNDYDSEETIMRTVLFEQRENGRVLMTIIKNYGAFSLSEMEFHWYITDRDNRSIITPIRFMDCDEHCICDADMATYGWDTIGEDEIPV